MMTVSSARDNCPRRPSVPPGRSLMGRTSDLKRSGARCPVAVLMQELETSPAGARPTAFTLQPAA
jgi:hypothetical protein